jgi:dTDP-4-amino-4,6-dideoxygalactose transaminase
MIPYGRQSISEADIAAVTDVLRSDWLTTGPAVSRFETDLASVTSAPCVAVSSGTAALHTAYSAVGIQPGDEIITSPLTFVATSSTAIAQGARVLFADIQADTGNIDPSLVETLITERTRAIVAVDYAGHPADLDELRTIANRHGLALIEDAAHSIGSTYRNRPVGSIADVTTFSFFPTKNLTTAEGGAVACLDGVQFTRAQRFRTHGLVRDPADQRMADEGPWHQEVHDFGLNYRLPDVLAALGSSQLKRLAEFKQRRKEIHASYNELLAGVPELTLPVCRAYVDPMWHLYPLRVPAAKRRRVFEDLRSKGVGVQVNYLPTYLHPVFTDLGYSAGLCPVAEDYYSREISLPMFTELTDSQVEHIASAVRGSLSN